MGILDNARQAGEGDLKRLISTRRPKWIALNKISCYIVMADQIKRLFFEFPRFILDFCFLNFVSKERFCLEFAWDYMIAADWLHSFLHFLSRDLFPVSFFIGNIFCLEICLVWAAFL